MIHQSVQLMEEALFIADCRLSFVIHSSVQVTKFLLDNLYAMSGSDDNSVMCWDIATGQNLTTFSEHQVTLSTRNSSGTCCSSSILRGSSIIWRAKNFSSDKITPGQ